MIDATAIESQITDALNTIAAIGGAGLLIVAALVAFKMFRSTLDDPEANAEVEGQDTFTGDPSGEDFAMACPSCGYESPSLDESLHAFHVGHCPKCGEEFSPDDYWDKVGE